MIESLAIHHHDYLWVEKGGEIIPKIVGVATEKRATDAQKIAFATHCPECGTALVKNSGEIGTFCPNELHCPPQIKGKLEHFISRKAMNIDSLGEGKVEILFDNKLVQRICDFYSLTYEMLLGIEKHFYNDDNKTNRVISFREKTVENILHGINQSKQVPFERVLFALGIRFVGETTAKKLARHFINIDALANASKEELIEVEDVGDKVADSIIHYFNQAENLEIILRLKDAGIHFAIEAPEQFSLSDKLKDKSIVVSGIFSIPRDELKQLIEKHGGKISSSISKKTDYLIVGNNMGPEKRKKAENLAIQMISEEEFYQLIQ